MQTEAYDFPVQLVDVFTATGQKIPNVKSVFRTDTEQPLSVVSNRYHLFTHQRAIETTNEFLKSFGDYKTTNFVERGGLRFVRECTFGAEALRVGDRKVGDVVQMRVSIINSYDGLQSLYVKVGAMVLKCLNGMTVLGGQLELAFRHTESLKNFELPDPQVAMNLFKNAGEQWNQWADTEVTKEHIEFVSQQALRSKVVSQRLLDTNEESLKPVVSTHRPLTLWDYYNNYTNILTHRLPRVQQTRKLGRFDRLNAIFSAAATGEQVVETAAH